MAQSITKLWIDESGDCGFKFDRGSSRFLVITAIYLVKESTSNIRKTVTQLKLKLNLTKDYEFKFSRCKDKFRQEFFKATKGLSINYKAIVVDKKKLRAPGLRFQPRQLYCELVRRLLYDNNPPLKRAVLVIDETTAKIHHKEFNKVLKRYLSKNIVKKIRQKRSKNEVMIQIADMIAGSILRKYKRSDTHHYKIMKSKEKILIEF